MRRNTTDSCIKVKDRPFAEGSRDLQRCQSSKLNRDENNFERYAFIVNIATKSSQYLPHYIHYPKQNGKVFTPPPPTITLHGHPKQQGTVHTNNSPGGFVCNYFDLILIFWSWDWASRLPAIFLVNDERSPLIVRITHLAWKILTAPSRYMSDSGIQNRLLFEGLEFGTCKFTGNGR